MKRLMLLVVLLGLTNGALAQDAHPTTARAHADTHPVLSKDGTWAGSMVITIIGLFVAAASIGVVVRLNMPEQPPEPQPYDHGHGHDDHGQSGGHGGGHGGHAGGHGH